MSEEVLKIEDLKNLSEEEIGKVYLTMREGVMQEQHDKWLSLPTPLRKKLDKHTKTLDLLLNEFIQFYSKADTKNGIDVALKLRESREAWKKYINKEKLLHQPCLDIWDANVEKLIFEYNQIVEKI